MYLATHYQHPRAVYVRENPLPTLKNRLCTWQHTTNTQKPFMFLVTHYQLSRAVYVLGNRVPTLKSRLWNLATLYLT